MLRPRFIACLLAFITLVVYLPVTRHDFVHYDDDDYVVQNQIVQGGLTLADVKWAFTTGYASNWHPVTWLSHMMDCGLFKLNAGAHHFVSALIHAANVALLFILLLRLTQRAGPSALVAALFAWHPLHVESVAWVAERKDVLSTFFALLTLLSYEKFARKNARRDYWLALFFFALGLMSKPMLVTLPFILLLLDFWPLQRFEFPVFRLSLLSEKIPFFLLAAASCVTTFLVQRQAMPSLEQVSVAFRLVNAPTAVGRYLAKIFLPTDLAIIYPLAPIPPMTFGLAVTALLLISVAAWRWHKTGPYFLVGWLWFLGSLVPVLGLVQVGSAALADRYTYIPSIGIFIAFAFALNEACERFHWPKKNFAAVSIILSLACLTMTSLQLRYWHDSETLFRHAIAVTKNNSPAHYNLGFALESQDCPAEALAEYREALDLNPTQYKLHSSIGSMLEEMGQPAEALNEYHLYLRQDSKIPALHNAIGVALVAQEKYDEALNEFTEAERLDSNYAIPYIETAKIFFRQHQDAKAVNELWIAARTEPYNYGVLSMVAHYLAANTNAAARDGQNALVLALKANDLSHGLQPEVLDILGMAFAETGDFTNATICVENALDLADTARQKNTEPFRQRIKLYENHQPWRESFDGTNISSKN
jgi:tetratricopeptide (TPR) repeat protein